MANVTFTRATSATASPATTQGLITFNTGNGCIYLGTGSSYKKMDLGLNRIKEISINCTSLTRTNMDSNRSAQYVGTMAISGILIGTRDVKFTGSTVKPQIGVESLGKDSVVRFYQWGSTTNWNSWGTPTAVTGTLIYIAQGTIDQ